MRSDNYWADFFASAMLITCVVLGGVAAMFLHWLVLSGVLRWLLDAIR